MNGIHKWLQIIVILASGGQGHVFDPCTTSFSVCVNGHQIRHEFMSVFVLPEEELHLEYNESPFDSVQVVDQNMEEVWRLKRGLWWWKAPETAGAHDLVVRHDSEEMKIRVFVMHPQKRMRRGNLNGYPIGIYPHDEDLAPPPPVGFVEVSRANDTLAVSPHFRLGDLVWRPQPEKNQYAAITTELLIKLEMVLYEVNRSGHYAPTLTIMNAYRTPRRNRMTGNVRFSRHQWGQAADLYVDGDGDGMIDDLNGDGRVNAADARALYDIVDALDRHPVHGEYAGGLGWYDRSRAHTPFIHVDTRGEVIRWFGTAKTNQMQTAKKDRRSKKTNTSGGMSSSGKPET